MSKALKSIVVVTLCIAVLVISFSILYYYVSYIPTRDKEKLDAESSNEEVRRTALQTCFQGAYTTMQTQWNKECETIGEGANCKLPPERATRCENIYKEAKDNCNTLYPAPK